jgi:peptidyl-prolyl cis-trans isomerase C
MIRLSTRFAVAATASLITLSACNAADEKKAADKPVDAGKHAVTVNGQGISQARVDMLVRQRVAQGQPDSPELRRAILEDLVAREVVYQEAVKKGLDKNPEIRTQIDLATQSVMAGAFIQDMMKSNPVTDQTLQAEYDRIKTQLGDKEYKARHILVEKEEEAKAILAQLKKGAKFEKLAEKSKDPGSQKTGGDLGWNSPNMYVKPFGDALVKLAKGKMTEQPVQTQFGWHIIKLDDIREVKAPSFEEVKPQLKQRVEQQQVQKAIADLRAKAKVEGLDTPAAEPAKK